MHLRMGALAAVLAGILGLLLGIIMVLHKSIWPAVIAHGLFDATNLALLPWWSEKIRAPALKRVKSPALRSSIW